MSTVSASLPRGSSFAIVVALHLGLLYVIATSQGFIEIRQPESTTLVDVPDRTTPEPPEPTPVISDVITHINRFDPVPVPVVQVEIVPEQPISVPTEVPPTPQSGSNVAPTPVITSIRVLQRVEPEYPAAARRAEEQGTALVRILVGPDGRPQEVQLDRSSGHSRLDKAALDAARRWRFTAATRDGVAMATWVSLPITFRLDR